MSLAAYAISDQNSRGRPYPVNETLDRTQFQRDYTRVLHSQAFRKLQQKTQVFSANLGDLFRTRITHSLEVEQVSRSIAHQLQLNEHLCGVLAIGHDIGHAPFGHMGQDLLDRLMADHGGFEHNLQALRLVDHIESPYPQHRGLNLMFETREGLLKHCSKEDAARLGDVAARHLDGRQASLEAQVVDWSDAIAYVHADLEDAFTMGVLSIEQLNQTPGYLEAWGRIAHQMPLRNPPTEANLRDADPERARVAEAVVKGVIREMMAGALKDLVYNSRMSIAQANPQSPEEARAGRALVGFGPKMLAQHKDLKRFSRRFIYTHPHIKQVRNEEERILEGLFKAFENRPDLLPGFRESEAPSAFYRRLADHLSGMTDRYALDTYNHLSTMEQSPIPVRFRGASQEDAANDLCYPRPSVSRSRRMG